MIEQTREIARSFNHTYNCDILVEPEGIYPENEAAGRLPGLDLSLIHIFLSCF